jgi:methylase of polypeptide subunit release factors
MERLDLIHILMIKGSDDKLYHAPIEKGKVHRILDIGTGTGVCMCVIQQFLEHYSFVAGAIEMGDLFPGAEVCSHSEM